MPKGSWSEQSIESPCVKICELDKARTMCIGCYRTTDEIGRWRLASDSEKRAIIKAAQARRP